MQSNAKQAYAGPFYSNSPASSYYPPAPLLHEHYLLEQLICWKRAINVAVTVFANLFLDESDEFSTCFLTS